MQVPKYKKSLLFLLYNVYEMNYIEFNLNLYGIQFYYLKTAFNFNSAII